MTVEQIVFCLYALLVSRALILECRKVLKELPSGNEFLRPVIVGGCMMPVGGIMTKAFGMGELRDRAFKVLAEMVREEGVAAGELAGAPGKH